MEVFEEQHMSLSPTGLVTADKFVQTNKEGLHQSWVIISPASISRR
jgi:hypothetical protein